MKKPQPSKERFFELLNRAVRKGEKVSSQKQKQNKTYGYNGKLLFFCYYFTGNSI